MEQEINISGTMTSAGGSNKTKDANEEQGFWELISISLDTPVGPLQTQSVSPEIQFNIPIFFPHLYNMLSSISCVCLCMCVRPCIILLLAPQVPKLISTQPDLVIASASS